MNKHMNNAKEIQTLLSLGRMRVMLVPLSEALGLLPLPLPEEIVTADVSQIKAGGPDRDASLPCGGNISLPGGGRLVCEVTGPRPGPG